MPKPSEAKPVSPGVLKKRFFAAARSGDVAGLRAALDAGMDVHVLDGNKWTALHEACRYGQAEAVKVLIAAGADPNLPHGQTGFTPMVVATFEKGHVETVRALLAGGYAPSLQDKYGWTALHKTARSGDLDALEALLQAGGDPGLGGGPEALSVIDCVEGPRQRRSSKGSSLDTPRRRSSRRTKRGWRPAGHTSPRRPSRTSSRRPCDSSSCG